MHVISMDMVSSFQAYEQMLKAAEKDSGIGSILPIAGRNTKRGCPVIQYEETDWALPMHGGAI